MSSKEYKLMTEAKKRGYVKGAVVKALANIGHAGTPLSDRGYYYSEKDDVLTAGGVVIYREGKWAEIVEEAVVNTEKRILLHVLMTSQMFYKKPDSTKVIMDWGSLQIIIEKDFNDTRSGLHCVVEDTEENLTKWMSSCKEFIKGNGSPQLETFTLIKNG